MILKRTRTGVYGTFGELLRDDESWFAYTLEPNPPKIPDGIYTCVRGMHLLKGMAQPFETFQVSNVPGHTNILIHVGNVAADTEGCVLLGESQSATCVGYSQKAFTSFMEEMNGFDQFQLLVLDAAS